MGYSEIPGSEIGYMQFLVQIYVVVYPVVALAADIVLFVWLEILKPIIPMIESRFAANDLHLLPQAHRVMNLRSPRLREKIQAAAHLWG